MREGRGAATEDAFGPLSCGATRGSAVDAFGTTSMARVLLLIFTTRRAQAQRLSTPSAVVLFGSGMHVRALSASVDVRRCVRCAQQGDDVLDSVATTT